LARAAESMAERMLRTRICSIVVKKEKKGKKGKERKEKKEKKEK